MKARFIGSQKVRGVKVKRRVVMGAESTDVTACPYYFGAAQQCLEPTIMI